MSLVPELRTERLLLRGPKEGDFEVYARFYGGERSKTVGGPFTRELAWRHLSSLWGHWMLRGYGRWMLERIDNGQLVGNVGLWNPEGWPEPEVGWTIFDGSEGLGFAYEAARASLTYAFEELQWATVISAVAPGNTRSRNLASRLGASITGCFEHERFGTLDIWRHPKRGVNSI